ncbi:MAG: FAD-dependent monooxygenase [Deltaproteobacteria bacterium]|nr:FAD-dependent monooxygenase [Deltaproteobacteria bacterium]MBW2393422.1 FAD-dependent monooxygenase [Deltaproteobacteria bacterium]
MSNDQKNILVIGGSVAGLGVGLTLSADGHRVTILESDPSPMPESHAEAFETWERKGAPQVWHSHALLGKLHKLIKERAPGLLDELLARGAEELPFADMARRMIENPTFEPEDEEIVLLACRRITFEWVLRRHVLDTGLVDFKDGVAVTGLAATKDSTTGLPLVTGVRLKERDGTERTLEADLIVDASGRRSKLKHWLTEIGARPILEESEPCGIFYTSRFYRLHEGAEPPMLEGPIVGEDLGYMKAGLFPGDDRVFSLTLAVSPDDAVMRSVLHQPGFEAAAAAVPRVAGWVSPETSAPISKIHAMTNLRNTRRQFVVDGEPVALGVLAVGDAAIHANPITGRGCTLAWMGAAMLADALQKIPNDLRALALEIDTQIEEHIIPWYQMQVQQDRDGIETERALQRGEDPFQVTKADGSTDPKAFMRSVIREGLMPAMRSDIVVLRRFMRFGNLLDPPGDLMRDPDLLQRILAVYNTRSEREPLLQGPTRSEMVDILQSLAA